MGAVLGAGLLLIGAGCGASDEPSADAPLFETNATVLEDETHGPMLCLGAIMASDPPICGNVPITNWDWGAVEGERSVRGAIYGAYYVKGTYDGKIFEVAETGPVKEIASDEPEWGSSTSKPACDEPAGGWVVPAGKRTSSEDAGELNAWAEGRPEYIASWVTYLDPDVLEKLEAGEEGPFSVIYSLLVDRDADEVEKEARKLFDGPLCVVQRDLPTAGEAAGIRSDAEEFLEAMGLELLGSDDGEIGEVAQIWIVADADGALQAKMDERFGPGLVRLVPELVLVNQP